MISFNKSSLFAIAAGVALLSSCSKETDFSDPNANAKAYAENWGKAFGDIDPNQDWNMAARTILNINLPYIKGEGVMRVFTSNPLEKGCCLMAETKINNGAGSIVFDAMKSMQQVFVSVEAEGVYRVYGYYAIENGAVNIGTNSASMAKNAIGTRAGECNVTKGEVEDMNIEVTLDGYYNYKDQIMPKEEFDAAWLKDNSWASEVPGWAYSNFAAKTSIHGTHMNGVEREAANPAKVGWLAENFGPGTFFQEQGKYYLAPKYGTFYSTPEELAVVEQGFSITSEGGVIELPFIYGATQNINQFGYVYYKDGQDPLAQPHYILMDDAKPASNIYFNEWTGVADGGVGSMELANWQKNEWAEEEAEKIYIPGHTSKDLVYGTKYKLTFFGENHDMEVGTYNFPAGYHIVFFIRPVTGGKTVWANYNYSLPELNKRIRHYYSIVPGQDTWQEDQTRGAVKAVSWLYKGQRFLGFEDGGADEDLNDIVFWVDGAYTPDQDEDIEVPSTDPDPEPEAQSWVIACEDLGSTDDFDFNDVVFSVSHVSGTNTATVTPLAAGGTLASTLKYNGQPIAANAEIHNLLQPNVSAGDDGLYPMLTNVPAGDPLTIAVDENFSMTDHKFSITVEGNGDSRSITMGNETGKAPMMLCLPGTWAWPKERHHIYVAYPLFKSWIQNSNENEWWKTVVDAEVVK